MSFPLPMFSLPFAFHREGFWASIPTSKPSQLARAHGRWPLLRTSSTAHATSVVQTTSYACAARLWCGRRDPTAGHNLLQKHHLRVLLCYYLKNGKPTGWIVHIKLVIRGLRESYGHTLAADFGPLAFKALRQKNATLPFMGQIPADMVRFQRYTGQDPPRFASSDPAILKCRGTCGDTTRNPIKRNTTDAAE